MKVSIRKNHSQVKTVLRLTVMGVTLFLFILVLLIPEITRRKALFKEGDIAPHDIYAPCRFSVPDYITTEKMRREAMGTILPLFNLNTQIAEEKRKRADEFFSQIEKAKLEKEKSEEPRLFSNEEKEKLKAGLKLNLETMAVLLGDTQLPKIREETLRILQTIMNQGVIIESENFPAESKVILRKKDKESDKNTSEFFTPNQIQSFLKQEIDKTFPHAAAIKNSISDIVMALAATNISADKPETLSRKEKMGKSIPLQYNWIENDEIIIRKGERINGAALTEIKAMEEALSKGQRPLRVTGIGLIIIIAIVIIFYYFKILEPSIFENLSYLAAIGLILISVLIIARLAIIYGISLFLLVPIAAGGMLVALLFDSKAGLATALLLSIFAGFITRFDFLFFMTGLGSSVIAIYRIRNARHRSDIIKAGFAAGVVNLLLIFSWRLINEAPLKASFIDSLIGLANGFICAILVAGCLPFFEYFLKITTNIKLLELSDLNHPLLKDMALKAAGSFQSSIMTGTLAEAAADAVGANALLARVGAYYHDIGKAKKPAYFTENQMEIKNRHEKLTSNISGLVLISHVRDGVELARQYRLPDKIINIIQEHHGTTLVFYFYHKALEEKKGEEIPEQNFRYPGPKPQSKEAGIVMLADSVEAASRTLADPTPGRIENLVKKIINNKFIDYQLDECELTLKDLTRIGESFAHHLTGILHSRIQYPEEKSDAKDSDEKSSEKEN